MANPPPGFPIVDFATLLKDVPSFFERMPRFFDGGYTKPRFADTFHIRRKLRSPDAEQMRDDIERARRAYEPPTITITLIKSWRNFDEVEIRHEFADMSALQKRVGILARRLDTARLKRLS